MRGVSLGQPGIESLRARGARQVILALGFQAWVAERPHKVETLKAVISATVEAFEPKFGHVEALWHLVGLILIMWGIGLGLRLLSLSSLNGETCNQHKPPKPPAQHV